MRVSFLLFLALVPAVSAGRGRKGAKDKRPTTPIEKPALNIVITNDDGFETDFIQSLFFALEGAGHNVIMAAPYDGQSGTSGYIQFLRPMTPTANDSPKGTLKAGSFPIGATTLADGQFYASTTPTGALLYGIDVLATRIFGGFPDLVISGPNEGNNIGLVTPHSGTLGAAITAINKGIPAIAVSGPTEGDAEMIAALTVKIVDAACITGKLAIKAGQGLNVNIPETTSANIADYHYKYTTLGVASNFGLQFFENIGENPFAVGAGIPSTIGLPAVGITIPYTAAGYEADTNPMSEGNAFGELIVTVSPIQGLYAANDDASSKLKATLGSLF